MDGLIDLGPWARDVRLTHRGQFLASFEGPGCTPAVFVEQTWPTPGFRVYQTITVEDHSETLNRSGTHPTATGALAEALGKPMLPPSRWRGWLRWGRGA